MGPERCAESMGNAMSPTCGRDDIEKHSHQPMGRPFNLGGDYIDCFSPPREMLSNVCDNGIGIADAYRESEAIVEC